MGFKLTTREQEIFGIKRFKQDIYVKELNIINSLFSESLIGYWSLDEGSGLNAVDQSGNGNDGALEGTAPAWAAGKSGNCVNFPGTDERVDCGNGAPLDDLGNGDFSISFWMKSKDTEPLINGRLFSKYLNISNALELFSSGTLNKMHIYFKGSDNGPYLAFSAASTPFDTNWNHIVLVLNRTTDKLLLYMNTIKDSIEIDVSAMPDDSSNASNVSWGALPNGSAPYEGLIDECRVYNRVLTEAEIEHLYLHPSGTIPAFVVIAGHDHDAVYLKLIGGTITGDLTFASGVDILHSGTNADKVFYFASDAYIKWNESEDTFEFSKEIAAADEWHDVGGDGEPAFQNSWVNYGGEHEVARFRKDAEGYVHIEGLVKDGTDGLTVFTLPTGYRRSASQRYPVDSSLFATRTAAMQISSDGTVKVWAGVTTYIALACVPFLAEA